MKNPKPCPECGQKNLYVTTTNSGGGYGPMLLPRLGGFWGMPKFEVVVCADCGLTRFFASSQALAKLPAANNWSKI